MTRPICLIFAAASLVLAARVALAGEHLPLIEHALSDTITHVGGKDDSVGNLLTFANPVFDATNRTQIGSDQGFCVRVAVGKSWECFWTVTLKSGQITVEGPFQDQGDSILAITGGTGKYTGAKGVLKLHPRDAQGSAYDFDYELQ